MAVKLLLFLLLASTGFCQLSPFSPFAPSPRSTGNSLLIVDTFDGSGTLASHTISPTNTPATSWNLLSAGTATVGSGHVALNSSTVESDYNLDAAHSNLTVFCDTTLSASGTKYFSILGRCQDLNNKIEFIVASPRSLFLRNFASGSVSGSYSIDFFPIASHTYTFALVDSGPTLTAYVDGQRAFSWSTNYLSTSTKAGVRLYADNVGDPNTGSFDNFIVYSNSPSFISPMPLNFGAYKRVETNTLNWQGHQQVAVTNGVHILVMGRESPTNILNGSTQQLWRSIDGGVTFTKSAVTRTNTYDNRNYVLGVTTNNTLVSLYGQYNASNSTWIDIQGLRSTDYGTNWTGTGAIDIGTDTTFTPYGPVVVLPSGKLIATGYGNLGATYHSVLWMSGDDGQTWTNRTIIVESGTSQFTETACAFLSGTTDANSQLIAIHRISNGFLSQSHSADGGMTWTNDGTFYYGTTTGAEITPWMTLFGGVLYLTFCDNVTMTVKWSTADPSTVYGNKQAWRAPITCFTSPNSQAGFAHPSVLVQSSKLQLVVNAEVVNGGNPNIYTSLP